MGDIIRLHGKIEKDLDNLICRKPWEFRRADWANYHFLQMLRSQSEKLEEHRREVYNQGHRGVRQLPPHYTLRGGMASTVKALFMHKSHEPGMREVYYLAGLTDCMINQVSPLLRTDLLRDVYNRVLTLKAELNVNWYGRVNQVLLPIDHHLYNEAEYRQRLSRTDTLKHLYAVIREGTEEMFDILSLEYTFYTPGKGEGHGRNVG